MSRKIPSVAPSIIIETPSVFWARERIEALRETLKAKMLNPMIADDPSKAEWIEYTLGEIEDVLARMDSNNATAN